MKSLLTLCGCLLDDMSRLCAVETTRDLIEIKSRAEHEGLSFLTITLPEFASEFERALETGQVDSTFFSGWKKKGRLPKFLWGFTSLVFEQNGRIKDEPSCNAVYCVRQICRVFKKVKIDCAEKRIRKAFENYVTTERALPNDVLHSDVTDHFRKVSAVLWSAVFGSEFNTFGLVPKHGPGATAERISGNAKYSHGVWNERLEAYFPVTEHYFTSVEHMLCSTHGLENLVMRTEDQELPVRVISVPKTLKAPRIIAIEPVCMQYTQQAIGRWIVSKIQRSELTRTVIRFDDQSVNQQMALHASSNRSFATIDLSDASDRVPLSMVRLMLDSVPGLLGAVLACRTQRAELPDGSIVDLKKFASMGSALCFPIESMYFYTIIVHSILWKQGLLPTYANIKLIARGIHVFGDDIIVPKDETDTVLAGLANYHCKVNRTKSFWRGSFRESCGVDAFQGVNVTPVYVREMRPANRRSTAGIVSWIATSDLFHKAGCWQTANFMKNEVESLLGLLPVVGETSPGLGWYSFCGIPSTYRRCSFLHRPLVCTYKVQARKEGDPLDGYPALLKYFLNAANREIDFSLFPKQKDKKHLQQSARGGVVSRKRHWLPAN